MPATCPTCGDEFGNTMGMKVHHSRIHGESIKGTVVECDNAGCNNTERRNDYEIRDNVFCSTSCEAEWKAENQVNENHPRWNGGEVTFDCDWCGGDGSSTRKDYERFDNHFCCEDCRVEHLRVNINGRGKDSPAWKGGHTTRYYGASWKSAKIEAQLRAQGRCENPDCDRTASDRGKALDVHHIVPFRLHDSHEEANNLDNLIVLCDSHHKELEPSKKLTE